MIQAEQCAMIVHNNGKCSIKQGDMKKLKPIKEKLEQEDLTVTIE
jgi:ATP-dependent Clp protease adaptor protein ClpS